MSDRIVLAGMVFQARHGVEPRERVEAQRFEVDLELGLDLAPAGRTDDLAETVDYAEVYRLVRTVVEGPHVALIEVLATAIAGAVLEGEPRVDEVVVTVRKPEVRLGGPLSSAGVQIRRSRSS